MNRLKHYNINNIHVISNVIIMRKIITLLAFVALFVPLVSVAHHSFGLYSTDVSELEGVLVNVAWRNPHVQLTFDVTGENGQEVRWTLEGPALYVLERRGISRDFFQPGEQLTIAGRANQTGKPQLWMHSILIPDGRELMMIGGIEPNWTSNTVGGDGVLEVEDAESQNLGIFRVWGQPALHPIDYGSDLPYREPPLPAGAEWVERLYGYGERCESMGMPGVMATPYPFKFTDQGSSIRLQGFSNNADIDRMVHLTDDADVEPGIMGHSVGHWETAHKLVVETTQIDWPYFDDSTGLPQSDELQIVEVFTLSDDQSRLDYRMTVTDSTIFIEPAAVIETYWLALGESLAEPTFCEG